MDNITIPWKTGNYILIPSENPSPPDLPVSLFGTGHEKVTTGDYRFDNAKLGQYHKGEVFQLTLKGRGWFSTPGEEGGRMRPVPAGSAFLASPDIPFLYRYMDGPPWEFMYLTFTGPAARMMFSRWRNELGSLVRLNRPEPLISRLRELHRLLKGGALTDPRTTSGTAYDLLLQIDSALREEESAPSVRQQTEALIRRNLQKITVERLAAHWGYEPHYFITWFRRTAGITPGRLIRDIRLEAAGEYLIHSPRSISDIAGLAGFEDPLYFSRSFRKKNGRSPREFRREFRAPILGEPVLC